MPEMTSMNVSLPESMKSWVEKRVKVGSYANASDYVRDLIRHDQEKHKDPVDEDAMASLREGIADLKAGRLEPAEALFDRLESKLGSR